VLANDHLIMITAHFPLFFLKIRHFFYRYQLVDPKDPTYIAKIEDDIADEEYEPEIEGAEDIRIHLADLDADPMTQDEASFNDTFLY
ncbi:MAG: hypothetical protein ACRC5A_01855, partial [Enterobacteriaceae bacterium]